MGALGFRNLDSRRSRIVHRMGLFSAVASMHSVLGLSSAFCDRSLHGWFLKVENKGALLVATS